MNPLDQWLREIPPSSIAPLFHDDNGEIPILVRGSMRKLKRHPTFDELMIQKIERGLENPDWTGLVYVMHWRSDYDEILPLYIGKAERKGVRNELSFNIERIRTNQHAFGRWGYGLAYHIGDLSHAVLGGVGYKAPGRKYVRWADRLLVKLDPPTLRRTVYVALIDWYANMCGPSGLLHRIGGEGTDRVSRGRLRGNVIEHRRTLSLLLAGAVLFLHWQIAGPRFYARGAPARSVD